MDGRGISSHGRCVAHACGSLYDPLDPLLAMAMSSVCVVVGAGTGVEVYDSVISLPSLSAW